MSSSERPLASSIPATVTGTGASDGAGEKVDAPIDLTADGDGTSPSPPTKRGGGRGRPPKGFEQVGGKLVKKTEGWKLIHKNKICDGCDVHLMFGVRHCKNGVYDLCDECFQGINEDVKGQYEHIKPTHEAYRPRQEKRKRTRPPWATGGSSSAAMPNAATAGEAAPAVAGNGAAPEGAGADVALAGTLFGDVFNVTNKLHSEGAKRVSGADYEAKHSCAAPWVFAVMPSCITNHGNCALPPSTVLYLDAIGSGVLSGRFALLADDPCSYVESQKQMKDHVIRFLKPAMASVREPGTYLNTSLTIIAHGNGREVKIGAWWVTPLMLAHWLRTWLGPDAGPSLKHIHLDSCMGLFSIRAEVQRAPSPRLPPCMLPHTSNALVYVCSRAVRSSIPEGSTATIRPTRSTCRLPMSSSPASKLTQRRRLPRSSSSSFVRVLRTDPAALLDCSVHRGVCMVSHAQIITSPSRSTRTRTTQAFTRCWSGQSAK